MSYKYGYFSGESFSEHERTGNSKNCLILNDRQTKKNFLFYDL